MMDVRFLGKTVETADVGAVADTITFSIEFDASE